MDGHQSLKSLRYISSNYTPDQYFTVNLQRSINQEEVYNINQLKVPGFKLHWHYDGMNVKPDSRYSKNVKSFVRNFEMPLKHNLLLTFFGFGF